MKDTIEKTLKTINSSRTQQLNHEDFNEISELHLAMERLEVEIVDDYRNLRQSCLKGLSQFSDDFSLLKIR